MKKALIAVVLVYVAWSLLDFVIHVLILGSSYEATASLWRPEGEMKMGLMYVVGLIAALAFVFIFRSFGRKDLGTGLKYGLWFGLGTGVSMGYGMYAVMPVPYSMAFTWFAGTLVEAVAGGLIAGAVLKDEAAAAPME